MGVGSPDLGAHAERSKVGLYERIRRAHERDMPGVRLPGDVRDVTFRPDSTAYLTVANPDDQTAGWLLRLGRADSHATILHTWLVDPVERYRQPYSVEYANDRLFVEALSANVFRSCLSSDAGSSERRRT